MNGERGQSRATQSAFFRTPALDWGMLSSYQNCETVYSHTIPSPSKNPVLNQRRQKREFSCGGAIRLITKGSPRPFKVHTNYEKERTLASSWSTKSGNKLPDNLQAILVKAVAINVEKIAITVSYEFDNFAEVAAEIQAKNAEGL